MSFLFYLAAILIIASALAVVFSRNPVHGGLALVGGFFMMGVIYILINQEFFAMIQVLVYAGAIMVLFLFFIMLINMKNKIPGIQWKKHSILAAVFSLAFVFQAVTMIMQWTSKGMEKGAYTKELIYERGPLDIISEALFTKYLLPFEVISLLLLVAVIGAVVIAKKKYQPE